jgi:hypothetical protein
MFLQKSGFSYRTAWYYRSEDVKLLEELIVYIPFPVISVSDKDK